MEEKEYKILYEYFSITNRDISQISKIKKITQGLYRAQYRQDNPNYSNERIEILIEQDKCIITSIKEKYFDVKFDNDHKFKTFIDVTKTIDCFKFNNNEVIWTRYIGKPDFPIIASSKYDTFNWESNRLTSTDFLTYIGHKVLEKPKEKIEFNLEEVFTKKADNNNQNSFSDISTLEFANKQKSLLYNKP